MRTIPSRLALSLALVLAACSKPPAEAPPATVEAATAPAERLASGEAAANASVADQDRQSALEETEGAEELAINEPMPPLDESSAPPKVLARAMLQSLRDGVSVSGEVTLYEDPYGTRLLRLENLRSPADLTVELALTREEKPGTVAAGDLLAVGALKGASGNMNYTLGADVKLSDRRSLVLVVPGESAPLAYCPLTPP